MPGVKRTNKTLRIVREREREVQYWHFCNERVHVQFSKINNKSAESE